MNIPKTPFKLNSNTLIYDVDIQSTGDILKSDKFNGRLNMVYPCCDIKDCGASAFYVAGYKRNHDEHKYQVYTQNLCEYHLQQTIKNLGIKED